jgi:hypothetical protein
VIKEKPRYESSVRTRLKILWRYRKLSVLTSISCISWSIAVIVPQMDGVYGAYQYLPWPWRAIYYFVAGAGWPLVTVYRGESKARFFVLFQSVTLTITGLHLIPQMLNSLSMITGVACYLTMGRLLYSQWKETPYVLKG